MPSGLTAATEVIEAAEAAGSTNDVTPAVFAVVVAGAEAFPVSRRAHAIIANEAGDCGVAGTPGVSVAAAGAGSTAATSARAGGSASAGFDSAAVAGALAALVSLDAVVPRLVWAVIDVSRRGLSNFDSAEVVAGSVRDVVDVVSSSPSEGRVGPVSDDDGPEVEGEPFVDGESFVALESEDASEGPASDDESDPVVSATATPGLFAMAAAIPRATANAPTRPMNLAVTSSCVQESSRGIDIEAHLPGRTKTRTWL